MNTSRRCAADDMHGTHGTASKEKGDRGRPSCVQGMNAMGHLPAVATGSVQAARNADVPPEEAGRSRFGR